MAVYTQAVLSPDPIYLQPKSYDARSDRKVLADIMGPGVLNSGDFAVTITAASLNISVAAGVAYILGQNIADQGMYRQYVATATALTVPANAAANPRIDTVILRAMDNAADASTFNECRIEIVPGVATAGATLANLTGKANLTTLGEASKSVLLLGYLLVPSGSANFTNTATNWLDARVRSQVGAGVSQSGGYPIGGTLEWNSTTVLPTGTWLDEDGSAISRTTYATLFGIVGTAAGVGDGSTTFNLPDSRGRVPTGYASSGGHADVSTLFANDGTTLANRRVRHRHTPHSHTVGISTNAGGTTPAAPGDGSGTTTYASGTADGGSGVATDPLNAPAYIVKRKIIRVA